MGSLQNRLELLAATTIANTLFNRPNMIGQTRSHSRRAIERGMPMTKIVDTRCPKERLLETLTRTRGRAGSSYQIEHPRTQGRIQSFNICRIDAAKQHTSCDLDTLPSCSSLST